MGQLLYVDGKFYMRAAGRQVHGPLVEYWSQRPLIIVALEGYEETTITESDLATRYELKRGHRPQVPWPFVDFVDVKLPKKSNQPPAPTPGLRPAAAHL